MNTLNIVLLCITGWCICGVIHAVISNYLDWKDNLISEDLTIRDLLKDLELFLVAGAFGALIYGISCICDLFTGCMDKILDCKIHKRKQ